MSKQPKKKKRQNSIVLQLKGAFKDIKIEDYKLELQKALCKKYL
jgi:hypothetical protein